MCEAAQEGSEGEFKLYQSLLIQCCPGAGPEGPDPLGLELAYSPSGVDYQYNGITVATDGSLKDDGCMVLPSSL